MTHENFCALYKHNTDKATCLGSFLEKYQPRDLHVTLKQPCFIKEENIGDLKQKVSHYFSQNKVGALSVVFDEVVYNKNKSGAIMVCARNAEQLIRLQKDLCLFLSEYSDYVEKCREEYEKNFKPHITIGDEISKERYQESLSYLEEECVCEGVISEVVLAVVNDMTAEEANDSSNKTIYKL